MKNNLIAELKIGKQIWMLKNLNIDRFRNGDLIMEAKSDEEWENADSKKLPAWCFFKNDSNTANLFGRIYNIHAVLDKRGLAPNGWLIPGDEEWEELNNFILGIEKKAKPLIFQPGGIRNSIWTEHDIETPRWWSTSESHVGWSFEGWGFERENYSSGEGLSVQCLKL